MTWLGFVSCILSGLLKPLSHLECNWTKKLPWQFTRLIHFIIFCVRTKASKVSPGSGHKCWDKQCSPWSEHYNRLETQLLIFTFILKLIWLGFVICILSRLLKPLSHLEFNWTKELPWWQFTDWFISLYFVFVPRHLRTVQGLATQSMSWKWNWFNEAWSM